jgi:antitoxin VapB
MLWHMPDETVFASPRRVRLFRNGRNQAVRIPREFELAGKDALMYRDGERLVIEPAVHNRLQNLLAAWEELETDWPVVVDPVPEPVELSD